MDLETENVWLVKDVEKRGKQWEDLQRVVQDVTNRGRRLNLRLVSLKECLENGRPREYVIRIISEALGVDFAENELRQMHRCLELTPDKSQAPRLTVMHFHSYLERERFLVAVREMYRDNRKKKWQGCIIDLSSDMIKDVANKRRKFTEHRKRLHELDVLYSGPPSVLLER
ncbi:hypothetical protein AAFF_G00115330 [Aldrovandia affinis]|uniref:Uncharacterized protein n=1 Tax=Aldrovandia affinis TaxID=143900 RepID=A0AAD7RSR8_9TELE|nr:hypothetical protein AAFF_G00115330 [Aldrovandia affinis]